MFNPLIFGDDIVAMANSSQMEGRGLFADLRKYRSRRAGLAKLSGDPAYAKSLGLRRQAVRRMAASDIGNSTRSGMKMSYGGSWKAYGYFQVPMAALSAAMAPHGHKASAAAGTLAPLVGSAAGMLLRGPLGAITGGLLVDTKVSGMVSAGVQKFVGFEHQMNGFHNGQGFQDSEVAWTMRQRAAQELSGSLTNARALLGREAAMMHV